MRAVARSTRAAAYRRRPTPVPASTDFGPAGPLVPDTPIRSEMQ
ncbi:hypothetical protein GA0070604_3958 [Micromonospora eburnea]|uniref:Uncharacterized protein n=1 Tax=Micromonospora eburnea TaxID=227316 RepID=A0A1C6UY61_9ACTN|nr:hypothetical protein GA0070604_3958 [Micromonospora eburnea]